ncbi:MAG: hypothetical protein ACFFCH_04620 [Promethearchaeota archaeon]
MYIVIVYLLFFLFLGLLIGGFYWYLEEKRRRGRRWLASKGEVIPDLVTQDSVRKFSDPDIKRIDLKEFKIDRIRFYRMRVHLRLDTGINFELTSKKHRNGKVYEFGEGETGVDSVDKFFWVESPDAKAAAQILGAPKVQNTLDKIHVIHSLQVMGDEIEVVFRFWNSWLDRIYDFVLALTHEMMDQI